MTPQLVSRQGSHLTEEQFGELLVRPSASDPSPDAALIETHLAACAQCAAELAALRESLSLFQQASTTYADNQLRLLPKMSIQARGSALQPVYWAAAAALLLAAVLPLQMLRHRPLPPPVVANVADRPTESDEALLDSVTSEISESVPTPMKALADPTANTAPSMQNSTQGKD